MIKIPNGKGRIITSLIRAKLYIMEQSTKMKCNITTTLGITII